jgi:MFS family permease
MALLFLFTVREPLRRETAGIGARLSVGPVLRHLRGSKRAYFTMLAGTVLNVTCVYAQISWLATLIIRIYGWSAAQAGTALAVLSVSGAISSLTVGWTISRLAKRGHSDGPVIASLLHSTALMIFGPLTMLAPTPMLFVAPYIAFNLFANWSTASALTGLSQIAPNELRGQVVALYTLLTGLVSLTVGAFSVGYLNDHVFTGNGGIAPSLATVFGVCGLLGVIVLSTGRPAFRAASARAQAWAEPG